MKFEDCVAVPAYCLYSHGYCTCWKDCGVKVKAVPLTGPEGSRRLRFPDYMTTAQDGVKFVNLMPWLPLPPPQEMLPVLISVRG